MCHTSNISQSNIILIYISVTKYLYIVKPLLSLSVLEMETKLVSEQRRREHNTTKWHGFLSFYWWKCLSCVCSLASLSIVDGKVSLCSSTEQPGSRNCLSFVQFILLKNRISLVCNRRPFNYFIFL